MINMLHRSDGMKKINYNRPQLPRQNAKIQQFMDIIDFLYSKSPSIHTCFKITKQYWYGLNSHRIDVNHFLVFNCAQYKCVFY